jgi:hypothetical protein
MRPPPPCKVMTRARAAVTAAGFTLADFDHTIAYFPFSQVSTVTEFPDAAVTEFPRPA